MSMAEIDLPCPFLELTGIPCPLCGGTRAFVQAAQLHRSFLDYNAVWVFVAALAASAGIVALLLRRARPERYALVRAGVAGTSGRTRFAVVAGITAIAWTWAIAHSSTIAD